MALLPLSCAEFALAGRDYPIAFIRSGRGKTFIPSGVFSFEQKKNLFIHPHGEWDAAAYLPAYVRRYPFCMTRITINGNVRAERVTCIEKQALDDRGTALFDYRGDPQPEWQALEKLLFEYEADMERTAEMCRVFADAQLFEPFLIRVEPTRGDPLQTTGLFRITESRLCALGGIKLKELIQKSFLGFIYAHLLSLANFDRLLERRGKLDTPS
jgi:hypothetical protein